MSLAFGFDQDFLLNHLYKCSDNFREEELSGECDQFASNRLELIKRHLFVNGNMLTEYVYDRKNVSTELLYRKSLGEFVTKVDIGRTQNPYHKRRVIQ